MVAYYLFQEGNLWPKSNSSKHSKHNYSCAVGSFEPLLYFPNVCDCVVDSGGLLLLHIRHCNNVSVWSFFIHITNSSGGFHLIGIQCLT